MSSPFLNKQQLKNHLITQTEAHINTLLVSIERLNQDAQNDTKSSAGDKYETSMEMLKQEQNKLSERLKQARQRRHNLHQLTPHPLSVVGPGALFLANSQWYYMSVALGKINFENVAVFCLSPQAPVSQSFKGKKLGETLVFQDKSYTIEALL